jgi:hypothetical protein
MLNWKHEIGTFADGDDAGNRQRRDRHCLNSCASPIADRADRCRSAVQDPSILERDACVGKVHPRSGREQLQRRAQEWLGPLPAADDEGYHMG